MAELLFVYGTLHPDRAPNEIADLVRHFQHIGQGTVLGHRYKLQDYPAVVLDCNGDPVSGDVFSIPHDTKAMARLDEYEEYVPASPQESLFLRQKTNVTLKDGRQTKCWIYVYSRSVLEDLFAGQLAAAA